MSSGIHRFEFSERMRPIADKLYREIVPTITRITRFDKDLTRFILDREFAIDLQFTLSNGMIMTGQEKFRQFNNRHETQNKPQFADVTVEYYNDPSLKIEGDWFNLASQFYFVGYASKDENNFIRYVFLDWLQVVLATQQGYIKWRIQNQSDGRAKASFLYSSFNLLPARCVIASKLN